MAYKVHQDIADNTALSRLLRNFLGPFWRRQTRHDFGQLDHVETLEGQRCAMHHQDKGFPPPYLPNGFASASPYGMSRYGFQVLNLNTCSNMTCFGHETPRAALVGIEKNVWPAGPMRPMRPSGTEDCTCLLIKLC
jgi:hypothetical protein